MHYLKYISFSLLLMAHIGFAHAASAPAKSTKAKSTSAKSTNQPVHIDVALVDKVGRSATEFFYTPIIGINYVDVTGVAASFFSSDSKSISNENNENNNAINVDRTELGGTIGFLVDGQYQIVSTSYWRAGFQTGLIYMSPADSEFDILVCEGKNNSGCHTPQLQQGDLEISAVSIPMLFTGSWYAAADKYITTVKLGPVITHQMYELDIDGFEADPDNENQILLQVGIDGRYRLGKTDNFLLTGFISNFSFGGGNNSFSGVDSAGDFAVYVGISFS